MATSNLDGGLTGGKICEECDEEGTMRKRTRRYPGQASTTALSMEVRRYLLISVKKLRQSAHLRNYINNKYWQKER